MGYMAGQLAFMALVVALIGGLIGAVVVMCKARPPGEDDEDAMEVTD